MASTVFCDPAPDLPAVAVDVPPLYPHKCCNVWVSDTPTPRRQAHGASATTRTRISNMLQAMDGSAHLRSAAQRRYGSLAETLARAIEIGAR
eukprot:CAMPEP_0173122552 /NCGR_PEP_ID=MMETSP1102-20130122/54251_1 /TAXON_ID=49646 /ORGANISM="Geminigera sp., Strain Caron Lab Isolate" /LENGTH=91 /DNA_ID=CAMNT_0014029975 /DNA_START=139 /DNA_END=415 /DNA_ORIENTATION=-